MKRKLTANDSTYSTVNSDDDEWHLPDNNPHLEQIRGKDVVRFLEADIQRIMIRESARLPYRRRNHDHKSVVHWGQRKLLVSEIEFLTKFAEEGITCIYAGAAPGTHIPFLSDLFPEIHFVLFDPSTFAINPTAQMTTREEYMTNEIANEFINFKTLLISDVRSVDYRIFDPLQMEEGVARDMVQQMEWYHIMKPVAALLKFRLPWTEGETTYLKGDIHFPVWGPQTTTESRLVVTSPENISYNNKEYEEKMFYFNTVTRSSAYRHDIHIHAEGIDHCYDCTSEIKVIKDYLFSSTSRMGTWNSTAYITETLPSEVLGDIISSFIESISDACNGNNRYGSSNHRTLVHWQKTRAFKKKIYDTENQEVIELSSSCCDDVVCSNDTPNTKNVKEE